MDTVPSAASVEYYAQIVQDRHARRMMLVAGERLLRGATDLGHDVGDELAGARMDLAEISPAAGRSAASQITLTVVNAADYLVTEPPASDQIIEDMFDAGDKVAIVGSSKLRKSFFLLHSMMAIATGLEFLGFRVPKPRRVLVIQFEIQKHHFHRRTRRMATGLGIEPDDLQDRLQIVNGRGIDLTGQAGLEAILQAVEPDEPDVIAIDPLYKISTGVENAAEDTKKTLGLFDVLAERTGAAVVYVHHDAKGFSGDRDIRDRGSGSGVLGRDYDACLTLTPHATEDDAVVIETLLRNYAPQHAITAGWADTGNGGYRFEVRPDLAPTPKTSMTARVTDAATFEACHPVALMMLRDVPMNMGEFKDQLRTKTGIGQKRIDRYVKWALTTRDDPLDVYEARGPGKHDKYIGTPDQITKLRDQT